eukprot:3041982-Alexandrium_andersonii.AAC.1
MEGLSDPMMPACEQVSRWLDPGGSRVRLQALAVAGVPLCCCRSALPDSPDGKVRLGQVLIAKAVRETRSWM